MEIKIYERSVKMNILKITKYNDGKNFRDIIKVTSLDNKNNIVKEEIFENIVEFDIDDSIEFDIDDNVDTEANRIRKDLDFLTRQNQDYEETNTLCLKLIYKLLKYVL